MFSNRILCKFLYLGECFVAIRIVYVGQNVRIGDSWLRIYVSSLYFYYSCKFSASLKLQWNVTCPLKKFLKVACEILLTLDNALKIKSNIKSIYLYIFFLMSRKGLKGNMLKYKQWLSLGYGSNFLL